jgi:hypothetical protein
MGTQDWLEALIVLPTLWQFVQLIWVWGLAMYGRYLNLKEGWFSEPMTSKRHLWEYAVVAGFLVFINTDLQLDGLLIVMKWQYIKEWWKHEKKFGISLILLLSILILLLILSPILGEW